MPRARIGRPSEAGADANILRPVREEANAVKLEGPHPRARGAAAAPSRDTPPPAPSREIPPRGRGASRLLSLLFLACLFAPLVTKVVGREPVVLLENRRLKPFPKLEKASQLFSSFPRGFEDWWSDHFGLRPALIRLHGILSLELLRIPPSSEILVGSEGWLYLGGDTALETFQARDPFTERELDAWEQLLLERHERVTARGAHLVVAFIPEKQTIYPERMPPVPRGAGPARLAQIQERLRARAPYEVVDLAAVLRERRQQELYTWGDTHWTELGALHAARAILEAASRRVPGVRVPGLDDYGFHRTAPKDQDLLRLAGLSGRQRTPRQLLMLRWPRCAAIGPPPAPKPWKNLPPAYQPWAFECCDATQAPRALMFHDSFGPIIAPFLAESFSRLAMLRHGNYPMSDQVLELERPDVVLYLVAERHLHKLLRLD